MAEYRTLPSDHFLSRYLSLVDDIDMLWATCQLPLPTCIWTNTLKTSAAQLARELHHELPSDGLELEPVRWGRGNAFRSRNWTKPGDSVPYSVGWYLVQEEIAMTAVCALDLQLGDVVLDLCAAPGNKTVQIAAQVGEEGMVVANEWKVGRLASLWSAIARMGAMNVATLNEDGRCIPLPNATFDRVLVDVPCSGEGTLRKHPHRDWSVARSLKAIARLVPIQQRLLHRALDLVKPGGVVVYSTCTFAPEENEAVLDAVLGDRAVVESFEIPGLRHVPGVIHWQGATFRSDLRHAHRYFPHLNDTGGFFVARLRRTDVASHPQSSSSAASPSPQYQERSDELIAFGDRFAIASEVLQSMRLWQKGNGKFWLTRGDTHPLHPSLISSNAQNDNQIDVQTIGIPLFRPVKRTLKPTTAALQRLGSAITFNVVELQTPEQRQQFLSGNSQPLPDHLAKTSDAPGYVHVRDRSYELGCGLWINGRLHSQIPKALRQGRR